MSVLRYGFHSPVIGRMAVSSSDFRVLVTSLIKDVYPHCSVLVCFRDIAVTKPNSHKYMYYKLDIERCCVK